MNWSKYRSYFPHLSDQIYLNHAGISPMNAIAQAAVDEYCVNRLQKNIEFWPAALEKKAYFIELISKLINAPTENIALTSNTSTGLNILTLGMEWKAGDRILLNNFEFPSNVIPFMNLKRFGVEVDFVHHRDGAIYLEDIIDHLHPRTRMLSISFVEFLNGFRNDLSAISKICRERDIIFCVDAIQGLGALQMDVEKMGIDFLSSGGHKWLMWPAGLGFVYISPRIFDQVYPAQAGWLSVENPFDFFNYQKPFASTAQRFEPGGFNILGIFAATASLEMMLEIGRANIEKKILTNTDYLINELQKNGYELYTSLDENHRSGIVTFYHRKGEELHNFLKNSQITVSLREGMIRVSPHYYNDRTDLKKFIDCMLTFDKHN